MNSLWAKLTLAVLVPLLFFVLLEWGLRLGGYGQDTRFFIPDAKPGCYRTNPQFTERFFPASFGLKPLNFRIAKEKPAGACRVFVVGESAAVGVPEPGFAIAPQLQAQLRAAYPGKRIDVYSLGLTAINSHVVRDIVQQAVDFEPDVFVVYMGNNEVVGPFGPTSVVGTRVLPPWLIRLSVWAREMRTGQLIRRVVQSFASKGPGYQDWRGMEMSKGKSVAADDPRMAAVYANFAANLDHILAMARDSGAKIVLSTVAVNVRDCSPFVSLHDPNLTQERLGEWQRLFDGAKTAMGLRDDKRARELFEQAVAVDPHYAESHFQLARLLEKDGELEPARRQYLEALQWDALRFRTDAGLNEIIRDAAEKAKGSLEFVDASRALGSDEKSTVAPAGHAFFFEHVHFTWEGNCALVDLLAPAVGAELFGASVKPARWLTADECADALGFTELGCGGQLSRMEELTGRPPFIGQSGFAGDRSWLSGRLSAVISSLSDPERRRAIAAKVDAARRRDPDNAFLVFHAALAEEQAGRVERALELNESLAALEPPSAETAAQKAFLLQRLGRAKDAESVLLAALESEPYYFQNYVLLGNIWKSTGQLQKGLDYFSALVTRMPDARAARYNYADFLVAKGSMDAAEQQWREILRVVPDDEGALQGLIRRLGQRGKADEALQLMLDASDYNPRSYANNSRLVALYDERGDLPNTVKYLRALAASGPVKAQLYIDLAQDLVKLGQDEQAKIALFTAQDVAAGQNDAATASAAAELLRRIGS